MSTTTELLAANERYERLRAAIEGLVDEIAADWCAMGCDFHHAGQIRAALDRS